MLRRNQMTRKIFFASLATAALLISFAEPGAAQVDKSPGSGTGRSAGLGVVPQDFVKMKLAAGFMVSLNVLYDSDYTGAFRIDEEGYITVPILGRLHIAGETVAEARDQIRKKLLDGKLLNDPQVDLAIIEYTEPEVTIIGEVTSPGKHPLLSPRRLVEVLALGGGTTVAAGNEIQVMRGSEGGEPVVVHYSKGMDPKVVEDVMVNPGDTVVVKRAGIVYVLGAVARPGGIVMQEQGTLNVMQAMSMAGGTNPTASIGTIYLLRRNDDGSVVYISLPYKKMIHGQSIDVQLHAMDMLYIPTSTIKMIFSNTQQIINAAAVSAIYKY
jgi:polysaccharide export outer membrane protein